METTTSNEDSSIINLVTVTSVSVSVAPLPTADLTFTTSPLLCENSDNLAIVDPSQQQPQTAIYTTTSTSASSSPQLSSNSSSSSAISQLNQIQVLVQPQSSSNTSSRMCQNHILTLPHIDEDDEDENSGLHSLSKSSTSSSTADGKRVQIANPQTINIQSSSSPKIKVSRIKFTQQPTSNEPDSSSIASVVNQQLLQLQQQDKMQAESGTIADLQQIQQKYLKNRRHTLANTAAINLRWVHTYFFSSIFLLMAGSVEFNSPVFLLPSSYMFCLLVAFRFLCTETRGGGGDVVRELVYLSCESIFAWIQLNIPFQQFLFIWEKKWWRIRGRILIIIISTSRNSISSLNKIWKLKTPRRRFLAFARRCRNSVTNFSSNLFLMIFWFM